MLRRSFLKSTLVQATVTQAGALALAGTTQGCNRTAVSAEGEDLIANNKYFPQSVASGDPTANSVIVWTRIEDSGSDAELLPATLEVAEDAEFEQLLQFDDAASLPVTANRNSDGCLRIRVDGLSPKTRYYYRFIYRKGDAAFVSRSGRTKTAPAAEDDTPVRFAVMSCQDYAGRYFHCHRHAAAQDLDFVVFLGDYIYETTDSPLFQLSSDERAIAFQDQDGALSLDSTAFGGSPEEATRWAARSLDNYRQLYRTYRSDPDLQALHEQCPFVCIWDDHEFSNDCHGQSATYFDGAREEQDPERRGNADQAWFEYMPVDYPAGEDFDFDREESFPDNLRLYRSLRFGKNVQLLMTDLRRYRSDHVIAEDAFPGQVILTQQYLEGLENGIPDWASPYIDLDSEAGAPAQAALVAAIEAQQSAWPASELKGLVSVPFLEQLATELGVELPSLDTDTLPLGVAYHHAGKNQAHDSAGARALAVEAPYRLIADKFYEDSNGQSEQLMGGPQEDWFVRACQESDAHWKIWGNPLTLMRRSADLTQLPVPDELKLRFIISADDWEGVPNGREALLRRLVGVNNLVTMTGDLHSFFAGTLGVPGGEQLVQFLTGSMSSATFDAISGFGPIEMLGDLLQQAGALLQAANPHLAYQNLRANGYATVEASKAELQVTFNQLPSEKVIEAQLDGDLSSHFSTTEMRLASGSSVLERKYEDEWRSWDPKARRFRPS